MPKEELKIPLASTYSGNRTLNKLLRSGFILPHDEESGLVVLLRGKPGTGKSTLALQILEGLPSETPRFYCSLEQTTTDLNFKRMSMLVAQALLCSWAPRYSKNPNQSRLICDQDVFWRTLRDVSAIEGRVKRALVTKVEALLRKMTIPLYKGPSGEKIMLPEQVLKIAELILEGRPKKADRAIGFVGVEKIQSGLKHGELPFGVGRSRSVAASRMLDQIPDRSAGKRVEKPIVVVDGLSLLTDSEREVVELQGLIERLRRLARIGIFVYEPTADESTSLDHHTDMVIELRSNTVEKPLAYLIHELCIRKARYQETALGQHQFKIRRSGLVFFPSVHFQVQHPSYMDFETVRSTAPDYQPGLTNAGKALIKSQAPENGLEVSSILDMIFAPKPGESVVLLGARGSFKTELSLDFLSQGLNGCAARRRNHQLERGLLISLIDCSPKIEKGVCCPWHNSRFDPRNMKRWERCVNCDRFVMDHVRPFQQPPGCISAAELLYYFLETIEVLKKQQPNLSRLVFWDLTQLDYKFPLLKSDSMLLPAMIDIFKRENLKSLFMGAENATNTPAASAMADNVVFCWRSNLGCSPEKTQQTSTKRAAKVSNWEQHADLMLYVDRASSSQRLDKALYRLPIYTDKTRECLHIPATPAQMNQSPFRVDWKSATPEDQEHVKKVRKLQGLE